MLSKARIKFIKSLQIKKYRKQEQCFIVQGTKSVLELLQSDFETILVTGTPDFLSSVPLTKGVEYIEATEKELEAVSEFQNNDSGIAIARMKPNQPPQPLAGQFSVALDDLRDPGNLGTVIRTCDWYGISNIIASRESADFYNPKVINATMGSFTRVSVFYTDLPLFLSHTTEAVYGAFLEGKSIHEEKFAGGGIIVIGNESRGISPETEKYISHRITIPRSGRAESLNAGVATAVILDNVMRSR